MWRPYTGIQINNGPETVQSGAKALVEEGKGRRDGLEASGYKGDYGVVAGLFVSIKYSWDLLWRAEFWDQRGRTGV